MFTRLKIKIRNFIQNHYKIILIIIIVWIIVLIINYFLAHRQQVEILNTTYTPHESVLKNDEVPEKLQEPIERIIDKFITLCNDKNYTEAFGLLTEECKNSVFNGSMDEFKNYVDTVFPSRKIYSIQNYSNYSGSYIYNVKILDDILATGLTDNDYAYYEEKYVIKQNGDKLTLSIANYIKEEELKRVVEDDYSKIRITKRMIFYDKEYYLINITNKTDNIMLIGDGSESNEIMLDVGREKRTLINNTYNVILKPGETKEFMVCFEKYFDEGETSASIIFDKIRILPKYSGIPENYDDEINNAIKMYSLTIPLK